MKHRGAGELVAAICDRHGLDPTAVPRLSALLELVARDPLAPTSVRDPIRIANDHLADSLVALELECVAAATAIADLGAGAGFPGLPLAVALPSGEIHLVEANGRKCDFLSAAAEACDAANAVVVKARVESWPDGIDRCDLVVARALAPLPVVAEYAAPLLRLGGSLVVWRGRRDPDEELAGARAAAELGLEPRAPRSVEPYPGALHRHLHELVKVSATPSRFPRRPGVARKRPLG